MKRPMLGAAALATAGALTTLTFAPAFATHTVAQASGNALTASIAGSPADSGTTTATNDGSGEVKTEPQPLLGALEGNLLVNTGVLLQDATAVIQGQDGFSAACAGVAGQGGSLVNVGDSSCVQPGETLDISLGNLDLTGVELIDPESALGELSALQPLIDSVLGPVTQAVSEGLQEPLEGLGIVGALDAVAGYCEAVPGTATGESSIAGASLSLSLPGMEPIVLADLQADGTVNQKVVTDPAALVQALSTALQENFQVALEGQLAQVTDPLFTDVIEQLVIDTLLAELQTALAPVLEQLEQNILDITINKQSRTGPDHIAVTALDVQVVPAAADAIGASLVELSIGNVTCGPNSRIHPPEQPPLPPEEPEVPTVVNSGLEGGTPADEEAGKALVAGGLLALGGAAGALGYRRFAAK